jgi:hypothetical protein
MASVPSLNNVQVDTNVFSSSSLSACEHVGNRAPVLGCDGLLNLLARKPLELLIAKCVALEVGLTGHDASLHEESALADLFDVLLGIGDGLLEVARVVADGCVSDDPCVHVNTSCLHKNALGGLELSVDGRNLVFLHVQRTWSRPSGPLISSSGNLQTPFLFLTSKYKVLSSSLFKLVCSPF